MQNSGYTIFEDITERKRIEEEVRLQGEITANMNEGIYLISVKDLEIFYATPRFEKMFGYDPGEMIGKDVSIVNAFTEMTPKEVVDHITGILKEAGGWQGEIQNIKKDGTLFWCYASASMFNHPKHGEIIISVHTDITDRKRSEEALRESERRYQDIYDNAPDMFASVDAKTATILRCNQTVVEALGYTKEEIIGRPIFDLYTTDSAEYAKSNVFPIFVKTGAIKDEELQLQRKDGSTIDVSLNVSAIRDEEGIILQSSSVWRDITKRKLMEAEVKTLSGFLPICASCKKIRDDEGYWNQIEAYIHEHSEAKFSHGICPECAKKLYPDLGL